MHSLVVTFMKNATGQVKRETTSGDWTGWGLGRCPVLLIRAAVLKRFSGPAVWQLAAGRQRPPQKLQVPKSGMEARDPDMRHQDQEQRPQEFPSSQRRSEIQTWVDVPKFMLRLILFHESGQSWAKEQTESRWPSRCARNRVRAKIKRDTGRCLANWRAADGEQT